ncbi:UNVERIFIED_CONTAM: hypothetical protein GTU68_064406 [Idotea baltica]|nr:hypothetical protein [Idotea baltica]
MWSTIISAKDAFEHLFDANIVFIDCRFSLSDTAIGRQAYEESHIPGSHYAHLDTDLSGPIIPGETGRHPLPEVSALVAKLRSWGISNESQVIIYDDASGGVGSRLWWMLRWLGFNNAAILDGGWAEWVRCRYPVTKDVSESEEGTFVAFADEVATIDASSVDKISKDNEWTLIDSRAAERYHGNVEPIDPIAGHIEGAINHPFSQNVNEDGTWKSSADLRKQFGETLSESVPENRIVFYCGSGVTACHNILAYQHAGLGRALLYPGSWSEWITEPDRL